MIDSKCGFHCIGFDYKKTVAAMAAQKQLDTHFMVNVQLRSAARIKVVFIVVNARIFPVGNYTNTLILTRIMETIHPEQGLNNV